MAHTASKAPQWYLWKRVEVFTSVFFLCLLAAQSQAVSSKAWVRTSALCSAPVLRWELRQKGWGGRVRDPTAREDTAAGCLGSGGRCWRKATGGLAMAVTSRVVSVKLSLVQPCVGRWIYLSLVMSKTRYTLAVFWKQARRWYLKSVGCTLPDFRVLFLVWVPVLSCLL